jgi:hypothetical protein
MAGGQLSAELQWLRGETEGSFLAVQAPERWLRSAKRAKEIVQKPELADFLNLLEWHNADARRPFLLGPYLVQVFLSSDERSETLERMPFLDQPRAAIRDDLRERAAKCKELAELLRKGPHVVSTNPCYWWLNQAAEEYRDLAERVHSTQHRKSGKNAKAQALRSRTASVLVAAFRQNLKRPYHGYVASLAEIISGIATDADYVKKIERSASLGDKVG